MPTTDGDRVDSVVEGDELPRLSGGEPMAEFSNPKPHKPPSAIRVSRILRVFRAFFDLYIHHPIAARMSMDMRTALHTSHKDDHERDDENGS
ncbi:MAG: hypothetical protein ACLP0B_00705 [Steroidobacteraceae bacterium]